jgi:spore coat protein CotH
MWWAVVVLCALALAGCGIVETIDARAEYQKSLDAYRACIETNGNNIQACEVKRVWIEVNERDYNNMVSRVSQSGDTTASVTGVER